jgi:hypothetical protein
LPGTWTFRSQIDRGSAVVEARIDVVLSLELPCHDHRYAMDEGVHHAPEAAVADESIGMMQEGVEIDPVFDDDVVVGESLPQRLRMAPLRGGDDEVGRIPEGLEGGDEELVRVAIVDRALRDRHERLVALELVLNGDR